MWREIGKRRWRLIAAACLAGAIAQAILPAATTDPASKDTDGDGYLDGPDAWVDRGASGLWLIAGEDKNGNGRIDAAGADGEPDTEDDETDPNNPASHPKSPRVLAVDSDRDGLSDALEAEFFTSPNDADTDDDGVKDGDEVFIYHTNPTQADSDFDGLPDGFELGLTSSADGTGQNAYNTDWFGQIDKFKGHLFRLPGDPTITTDFSFMPTTDAGYRSDPNCFDSDFDGVWDSDELHAGTPTDPMRGLSRCLDDADETDSPLHKEPPDYVIGNPPVNRDYKIFLNKVMGEDDAMHWETTLGICLGRTPETPIVLTAMPGLNVFENASHEYVSTITVTGAMTQSNMGRYAVAQIHFRCPEPLPETLVVAVDRGGGDVKNYSVGLSSYYANFE
jgi:hypothetical protein